MLIREDNASQCCSIWDDAARVATSRITYIEAQAAVASAARADRVDPAQARSARALLDDLWREVFVIEFDGELMYGAAACAREYGLRGFDAVHCAGAMTIGAIDMLAVSGDKSLVAAWVRSVLAVADTSSG